MARRPSTSSRRPRQATGCASLFGMAVTTCLMVILNGALVSLTMPSLTPNLPRWVLQPKVLQSLMFVLPVILTIAQWWLFDLAGDLLQTWRSRHAR